MRLFILSCFTKLSKRMNFFSLFCVQFNFPAKACLHLKASKIISFWLFYSGQLITNLGAWDLLICTCQDRFLKELSFLNWFSIFDVVFFKRLQNCFTVCHLQREPLYVVPTQESVFIIKNNFYFQNYSRITSLRHLNFPNRKKSQVE